jgi:hypothetical protein
MTKNLTACAVFAAACLAAPSLVSAQSLTYTKGQNVAPAYEGWEQDADGSKWFVFGYMNRNWVEQIDIAPGPDNGFSPGSADQGQPTHFLPRRNRFVFRVAVPRNFTEKDELIWTITSHGVTEKAWATIRADYLLDDVVKASETGALGAGTSSPETRSNKAPAVTIEGQKTLTAKVGQPLTLTAIVKDDGIPKRPNQQPSLASALLGGRGAGPGAAAQPSEAELRQLAERAGISVAQAQQLAQQRRNPSLVPPTRITVGKVNGLHMSWFVYRGAGDVTFSPDQTMTWEDTRAGANSPWAPLWQPPVLPADGKIVTTVTFSQPGTYVLRSLADDGALTGGENVTVTVTK